MLLPWNIFSVKIHTKSASNAYFRRHAAQMHHKCIKLGAWGLQEALKTAPGRLKTDFASVLGANLRPSWSHVGHSFRPRRFHDASKTIPRAPQDPIQPGLATKTGVHHRPRWGTPSAQVVFWSIFVWFLVDVGWFLVDVWVYFLMLKRSFFVVFSDYFKIQWSRMGLSLCAERWRFILSHIGGGAWLKVKKGTWLCIGSNILYIWFSTISL